MSTRALVMRASMAAAVTMGLALGAPTMADASAQICTEPSTVYWFSSVAVSSRPTNVKSAYVTGPATISYSKTVTAAVGMTASSSVTAEAGVVLASASTQLGVKTLAYPCSYTTAYSGQAANAPRTTREDEWKLVL